MLITPMRSPNNTNREKLYILQGGKGALHRRGMAYDSMGPTPTNRGAMGAEPDPVTSIVAWCRENLPAVDVTRLCQALGSLSREPVPVADDDPSVDPRQTKGRAPGARVGMDAASMASLFQRIPDLARIGRA
jgi:hypothetical protein